MTSFKQLLFSIWGTLWVFTLIPIVFFALYSKLPNANILELSTSMIFKDFTASDYFILFYLLFIVLRLILLFLFAGHLKIERSSAIHIEVKKPFLIAVTTYCLYLLLIQPTYEAENMAGVLFNVLQSSVFAFIPASVLLDFYYTIFSSKPYVSVEARKSISG